MSRIYALIGLATLAYLAYVPSLSGAFVLDDDYYIARNVVAHTPSLWPRYFSDPASLRPHPVLSRQGYRPVAGLSFGLNAWLGGDNPFWFHLGNTLLHAANTCLIFETALALGATLPASFAAAALFCLHPAQVEAVAYIGSRPTLLALFFSLVAILLYRRSRELAAYAAFALALLSQEGAAFLPLIVAAFDRCFPGPVNRKSSWRGWPAFGAIVLAYLGVRTWALGQWAQRGLWGGGGWVRHLGFAAWGVGRDLAIAFWPAHLRYCYALAPATRLGMIPIVVAIGIIAATGGSLWLLKRRRAEGFALAWFFAALLPVANLVPIDALAADRFLYIPLAGLAWFVALACSKAPVRTLSLTAALLCAFLGYLTLAQEQPWQSLFELELHAYQQAPADPCTSVMLARQYAHWGMQRRAREILRMAGEFTN